jgi:hypothetical protein
VSDGASQFFCYVKIGIHTLGKNLLLKTVTELHVETLGAASGIWFVGQRLHMPVIDAR